MAPELFQRKARFTVKSDIYSLGMTLWELASRAIPFQDAGGNDSLIKSWVQEGQREEIPKDCPDKLVSAINACWAAEPDNRPTAQELTEFLYSEARDIAEILPRFRALKQTAPVIETYEDNLYSLPLPPGKKLEFKRGI
jgi:serine/threonine protein kinase